MPASAGPNDNDDGFIDIDELLSSIQQESVPVSADLSSAGGVEMVKSGTRGCSPTDSSRSTAGSSRGEHTVFFFSLWPGFLTHTIPDLIILSDNKSAGAESKTDCSDLGVDVRAKSDSALPHVADSELADGDGIGSGAALIYNRLVVDRQDDDNDHNTVANKPHLRLLANRPRSAFP
jgi:hypothetical protein